MQIQGQYYYPASSKSEMRIAHVNNNHIKLLDLRDELKFEQAIAQLALSANLPGLAVELNFTDGGRFVPDDPQFRWPFTTKQQSLAKRITKNKLLIVCTLIFIPVLIWLLLYKAMASSVVERMSEQSFYVIEEMVLEPTSTGDEQQEKS
ncbi:MAG: hypothetical protein ACTH7Q_06815 [Pseudoalteromonas sp.]